MSRVGFRKDAGRARHRSLAALTVVVLGACSAAPVVVPSALPRTTSTTASPATTAVSGIEVHAPAPAESPPAPILTAGSMAPGSWLVAHAEQQVEIYESPQMPAPNQVIAEATILGSPRVFLVESGPVDGWVEVSLPVRPNGSTGWVRENDLNLLVLDFKIFVDLSDRRLRLEQGDEVLLETEVAIGSPRNPTPTGEYYVTDVIQLANPAGPWGPFALGLSAFSDTITEFNGGDGIIGIHGTNRPASIGQPVSLGCVRVPNEIATQLADLVKLGTPVQIQA